MRFPRAPFGQPIIFLVAAVATSFATSAAAFEFLGVEPGVTTEQQLLSHPRWGNPRSRTEVGEAEQLDYQLRAYKQVRVLLRGGVVQTIDVSFPGLSPATVASALKLGEALIGQPLPDEAMIGTELPPDLEGLQYSAGRVALFTNPETGKVDVMRVFAATKIASRPPASEPPTASLTSAVPDPPATNLNGPTAQTRQIVMAFARLVPQLHLSQHPLDDQLAERALYLYLKSLDPQKMYFSSIDVRAFRREVDQLDDGLRKGDLSLAYDVFRKFQQRVNERIALATELLDEEHDFTVDEDIPRDNNVLPYLENELEFREYWRKRVKYQMLTHLVAGKDLEAARRQARKDFLNYRDRVASKSDDDVAEVFLDAVALAYDPHSKFISERTWKNFLIDTRKELFGIGASLNMVDGFVQVVKVISGGPADKDGRLNSGDRILAVAQDDEGAFVDATGKPLNEVVEIMRGKQETKVRLRVLPKGEFESKIYELVRDRVNLAKLDATVLSSEHLPVAGDVNVGFIRIPSFYGNVGGDQSARSVTDDLKPLLEQMSKKDVDLLVLDLRSNGGGTLVEPIETAALFIGEGPSVQAKYLDGKVQVYATSQGNQRMWNRPLAVLVDGLTGSGAEIFVAAIQDYGAGIVIGELTCGNGVVQTLTDIGKQLFPDSNTAPALGRLRLTTARFYRVNGVSPQLVGVTPDVVVPSLLKASQYGESAQDFPMKSDRVKPASYNRLGPALSDATLRGLSSRSQQRRAQSEQFDKLAEQIRLLENPQPISLNLANHQQDADGSSSGEEVAGELPGIREIEFDFQLRELLHVATEYLSRILYQQGERYLKTKKVPTAIESFQQSASADPLNSAAHFKLAWVLSTASNSQLRDGQRAVRHAQRACELDGNQKWSYLLCLAIAQAEAGDFDQAKQHLADALAKAPEAQRTKFAPLKQRFENRQAYAR